MKVNLEKLFTLEIDGFRGPQNHFGVILNTQAKLHEVGGKWLWKNCTEENWCQSNLRKRKDTFPPVQEGIGTVWNNDARRFWGEKEINVLNLLNKARDLGLLVYVGLLLWELVVWDHKIENEIQLNKKNVEKSHEFSWDHITWYCVVETEEIIVRWGLTIKFVNLPPGP